MKAVYQGFAAEVVLNGRVIRPGEPFEASDDDLQSLARLTEHDAAHRWDLLLDDPEVAVVAPDGGRSRRQAADDSAAEQAPAAVADDTTATAVDAG